MASPRQLLVPRSGASLKSVRLKLAFEAASSWHRVWVVRLMVQGFRDLRSHNLAQPVIGSLVGCAKSSGPKNHKPSAALMGAAVLCIPEG